MTGIFLHYGVISGEAMGTVLNTLPPVNGDTVMQVSRRAVPRKAKKFEVLFAGDYQHFHD